ncbi:MULTISPECIES: cation:proton antiporter [unclassified Streptomyces]|uniref:hypothetical protein n=1 Tax=unclassified Streptomyces TaxID=2593676 RepID=UPI002E775BA7|nr:hypothetical protein [Streptomyces sp. JV184]MEE1744033.1 hypothetical protein [Streptomyces sp. JV184]
MSSNLITTVLAICGTLLGSGLTAFVTARTDRRRNEALERQQIRDEAARDRAQRRELRAEHQKWSRDRRQAAYQSLMDAAHEAQGAIWQLGRLTPEAFDQHRYDIRRGAAIDAVRATRRAADAVQLEGPTDVAEAAEAYAKAVDRHIAPPIELLMQLSRGPLSNEQHARYRSTAAGTSALVESCRQRFVPLARRALDGSMDVVD